MRHLILLTLTLSIPFIFLFNSGCSSDNDQKKLGEAQACLDQVPTDDPTSANDCFAFISSVDSPQADAIRCSIGFLGGGINTPKIIDAVKRIDSGSNSEEVFISLLVFNGINASDEDADATGVQAIINVVQTAQYCNDSGVKGLQYLGNFAVAGTALIKAIKADPDTAFWSSPSFVNVDAEVSNAVNGCAADPSDCSADSVGAAIVALSDSYCATKDADDTQCAQVNAAIAAGGGDTSAIGAAFFDELNKP